MKGPDVELVLALQFNKPHGRACRGFRDSLCVAIVILLRLDIGSDVLRRHEPHVMAVRVEDATEVMSAAACLHPNNTRRQLLRQPNQRGAPRPEERDHPLGLYLRRGLPALPDLRDDLGEMQGHRLAVGWHISGKLRIPSNISLIPLPAKCLELNPQANIWQFLRDNWLSNRILKSYDDIVDDCCAAWNRLIDQP
jgi:hypothetical protein